MLLLVSIFVWSATKASWKKNVRKRSSPPKKRKPKRSKRRAKPP
jgi:hypothetical protein